MIVIFSLVLAAAADRADAQDATPPPAPPPADTPPADTPPPAPSDAPAPAPAAPTPPPITNTTLRGVVTSQDTGAPQAGATVTISTLGAFAISDDKGGYEFTVPTGTHVVRVEAIGYAPIEQSVTVTDGPATLDFKVLIDPVGEIIQIVGARTPRSRLETSVPVDIITSDVITESSHSETNQLLNVIAPSFQATHLSITDGTDHIDPASLRGLGPEHVLVLVNGRRLHQSSLINVFNGGTVGADLNAIPTNAIARIEVLRDGAASQYGSDAIAGVINIVLKENTEMVNAYAMTGITGSGDGAQLKIGGNAGYSIGTRGYYNITGEMFLRGRTNRSDPYAGNDIFPGIEGQAATDAELQRRNLTREDVSMQVGQSGARVGTGFFNAGYKLNDVFELHSHGGYTYRRGYASGFYRYPSNEARVDLEVYADGFLPQINPRMHAWTATAGLRGRKGVWDGDFSVTHGGDRFQFRVENSMNASLGTASPKRFDAGTLMMTQTSLNFDNGFRINQNAFKALSVVAGAEARFETYGITAGQRESYILGPEVQSNGDPKAAGSQVFPGFQPSDETDRNRRALAVYAGIESQPNARSTVDVGARAENYDDFGSTVIGKVAGRYALVKTENYELAARAAVSTGFRAPGLQQVGYSTVATNFINDPNTNEPKPTDILISPNGSAVSNAFGVPELKEETSVNFSGGFTARLAGSISMSADYYRIQVKDRVVLTGLFDKMDATIGEQITTLLESRPTVGAAQFFVNAVDTTTNGVDIVFDHTLRLPKGSLKSTAAANFTKTKVDEVHVPATIAAAFAGVDGGAARASEIVLGRYGRNRLEDLLPWVKASIGTRFDSGPFSIGGRANFFGPTEYHAENGPELDEDFEARVIFDIDVGYRIASLTLSVGANNLLNTFPSEIKEPNNRDNGAFKYSPSAVTAGAPYGIEGGFYYVRADYKY